MASNDFVISTDLIVLGMSFFDGGQTFDGVTIIDVDDSEALLVRKDSDGGDVFIVDTVAPTTRFGTGETTPTDIIILDTPNLVADGVRDSHAILFTAKGFDSNGEPSPHDVDWKMFVDAGLDTGERSQLTVQARIDGAGFADIMTLQHLTTGGGFSQMELPGPGTPFVIQCGTEVDLVAEANVPLNLSTNFSRRFTVLGNGSILFRAAGPHVFGGTSVSDFVQFLYTGSFTSGGSGVNAQSFALTSTLIGASGDTGSLTCAFFNGNITTQSATENIADVSQVRIDEPNISDNLTGDVTTAHTLFLVGSPTEGVSNFVLRATGAAPTLFQGLQFVIGDFNVDDFVQVHIGGIFTSGGSSTTSSKFVLDGTIIGAAGDTAQLNGALLAARITTQTATENITDVSGVHIVQPNIVDNLTGFITNAQTLLINGSPTQGLNNFALRSSGAAPTMFQGVQFVVGDFAVDDFNQILFGGAFTSGGSSDRFSKVRIEGRITGAPGDTNFIHYVSIGAAITTQSATENIANIASLNVDEPSIADNLTGDITNAQTLLLSNTPTEGEDNFAIRSLGGAGCIFAGQSFIIGTAVFTTNDQVLITGAFTSTGLTTGAKLKVAGGFTGSPGLTSTLNAVFFDTSVATQTADEVISDLGQCRIDDPSIINNLTGSGFILSAYTLFLGGSPTEGVNNFALRSVGPAPSIFGGVQFVIGSISVAGVLDRWGVLFTGSFTSGGSSNESAKFRIEGSLTGAPGDTAGMVGAYFDATFVTQSATENIADISQARFDGANITDNLTGDITNAQTLFITASPTAGVNNWTIRSTALAPSLFQGHQFSIGRNSIFGYQQVTIGGGFVSGGGGGQADKLRIMDSLTGASGDGVLNGAFFACSITTQTAAEVLSDVAQVRINEPGITLGAGSSITNASTLLIANAPTEGVNNFALRVASGDVIFGGNLTVSGAGPHAIAGAAFGAVQLLIGDTFTSDGSSNIAAGLFHTPTIVGAPGDTDSLTGTVFTAGITTQTATESIANISQLQINEPFITDNLTGSITDAQSLLITGAPTEGVTNNALRIASGTAEFPDGAISTPSIHFSDPQVGFTATGLGIGFNVDGDSIMFINRSGVPVQRVSLSSAALLTWTSGAAQGGGPQFALGREVADFGSAAVGDLFLANTNFSIYQNKTASSIVYHRTSIRTATETLSSVSGASVTTASIIPAGALVLGVTTDVDVALGTGNGTTGYEVGDGSDADRWGSITGTATTTFSDDADFTTTTIDRASAAGAVTITALGGNFDGSGDIVVVVHYMEIGARK